MKKMLLNTRELAGFLGVQGATVRRSLCLHGHYLNLRPVKLPNGRLCWRSEDLAGLIKTATGEA
jgi:hypothetical protein